MNKELSDLLRVMATATAFAAEPETIGVFTEWARKGHEESIGGKCTDKECAFNNSPEQWRTAFNVAVQTATELLVAGEIIDRLGL